MSGGLDLRLAGDDAVFVQRRGVRGRAYRGGRLVCGRVQITIAHDDRLGLTRHERRYVTVRFEEHLDHGLRSDLTELTRRRGAAARRIADVLEGIELVLDESTDGWERIIGHPAATGAASRPPTRH